MPDDMPWPTPEEEAALDRANDCVAAELASGEIEYTPTDREETARQCEVARQYRQRREAQYSD